MKSNLLILSPLYPFPTIMANQKDIVSRLNRFKEDYDSINLACFPIEKPKAQIYNIKEDIAKYGIDIHILKRDKKSKYKTEYFNEETFGILDMIMKKKDITHIWIEYSKLSELLPWFKKNYPKIILYTRSHNFELFHLLEKFYINYKFDKPVGFLNLIKAPLKTIIQEFLMLKYSDKIYCISNEDKKLYPIYKNKLEYFPYKQNEYYEIHKKRNDIDRLNLFYMGSDFSNSVNLDGLKYIVDELLPLIEKNDENICISILGKNIPNDIVSLKSKYFNPIGFVNDLNIFLRDMDVSLLPIRYGYGMKIKTYESIARGFPCVGLVRAFRGFKVDNNDNIFIFSKTIEFLKIIKNIKKGFSFVE